MYSFNNDYSEYGHPSVLEAIMRLGMEQNVGYGTDKHCENARQLIRKQLNREDVDIHFLAGGTVTNLCAISHALMQYEGVIAPETGHIAVHETGAIEASGHKVLTVSTENGKLTPALIEPVLERHENEHMVLPKMVYLSQTTELGTVYTKQELEALSQYCKERGLLLYLDGARLSAGLAVKETGLSFSDLPNLVDMFYIGGTKSGAVFGEALVIIKEELKDKFRYSIKQRGGMFAKGFLLGVQFEELFKDGLYFEMGRHANKMAQKIKEAFTGLGYPLLADSSTNQIFVILPEHIVEELNKYYLTMVEKRIDEKHLCIRFVTSWATKEEEVLGLVDFIRQI